MRVKRRIDFLSGNANGPRYRLRLRRVGFQRLLGFPQDQSAVTNPETDNA